jgi:hypothetical protein
MPCNCLKSKCEICHKLNINLVNEYHKINLKLFNVDDYETELIQRLNYEIIFKYLEKKTLIDSTFLVNDNINCCRDDGHHLWMIYIVQILLEHNVSIIGLDLKLSYKKYQEYIKCEIEKENNNEENSWKKYIKNKAEHDANKSYLYMINNKQKYADDVGWEYYEEPVFIYNGIHINNNLIDLYHYYYCLYFDELYYYYN